MLHTDICIAGAGVIGLALALELQARKCSVIVVEAGQPLREASWAAAGMLAALDPHNPAELSALAQLSASLYPEFLERLVSLGGMAVPFQTYRTLQYFSNPGSHRSGVLGTDTTLLDWTDSKDCTPSGFHLLQENSVDPRQLAASLIAAVETTRVRLLTGSAVISTRSSSGGVQVSTPTHTINADHFVDCTGAWAGAPEYGVLPIKGQMLAVALPSGFPMKTVVRTESIYIVPRTAGPNAGQAIIGATVEDIGFDKNVHQAQIEDLLRESVTLLPKLGSATVIDSWAGLRPATQDRLPILGAHPARAHHWVATGHYRNGILLAPATARVMTQLLLADAPSTPLDDFSPTRSSLRPSSR